MFRRTRKKRASEVSDEDDAGSGTEGEDSDVEMADVDAFAGKHRKSDTSEAEKQTRASRLSARTRAKVGCMPMQNGMYLLIYDCRRDSNGSPRDGETVSDGSWARYCTVFFFFFALYYDLSFNDPAVGESAVCVKKKHNTVSVAFFLIYLTTHE